MTSQPIDTQRGPHPHKQVLTTIRPGRGLFDLELADAWAHRELFLTLVVRDLKVLYRQAFLGVAWAVLQPILAVLIFSVVFGGFARIPSGGVPYPVFSFAAVLPWTYFAEAVRRTALCLVNDSELVRKVYFPRIVMPLASIAAPIVDFALGFVVLLVMMMFYHVHPTWRILAVVPLLVLTAALALSVGLWLGPLNVRYRDIKHTLTFGLQVWMYATPVVYPLSIVHGPLKFLYTLNPMVGLIEGFRWAIVARGDVDVGAIGIGVMGTMLLLGGGIVYFKQMERSFADLI